jgi:hypothetical protein
MRIPNAADRSTTGDNNFLIQYSFSDGFTTEVSPSGQQTGIHKNPAAGSERVFAKALLATGTERRDRNTNVTKRRNEKIAAHTIARVCPHARNNRISFPDKCAARRRNFQPAPRHPASENGIAHGGGEEQGKRIKTKI